MPQHMGSLTPEEKKAIGELENRVKNDMTSPVLREDTTLFFRFLKARDFDLDKAEIMLREHIMWRKQHQTDRILQDFEPKEVYLKYFEPCTIGYDKDGDIVKYSATGRINTNDVCKCLKYNSLLRHWEWFAEKTAASIRQKEKTDNNILLLTLILDLDKLEFANATSKQSTELFLHFTHLFQDNYPERLKSLYVINAPSFYVFLYSILKAVMSTAILKKIHVFGYSGWKERLSAVIDSKVLPAFLGGERTDPDGDRLCKTFITLPGKIPEHYYLTKEERYFKDSSEIKTVKVPSSQRKEISVDDHEDESVLQWRFMSNSKSIGFGLFFQESENDIKEIIPVHEYHTSDGTEESSHKCLTKGKYVFVYENNGWFSKEVQYCIIVQKP